MKALGLPPHAALHLGGNCIRAASPSKQLGRCTLTPASHRAALPAWQCSTLRQNRAIHAHRSDYPAISRLLPRVLVLLHHLHSPSPPRPLRWRRLHFFYAISPCVVRSPALALLSGDQPRCDLAGHLALAFVIDFAGLECPARILALHGPARRPAAPSSERRHARVRKAALRTSSAAGAVGSVALAWSPGLAVEAVGGVAFIDSGAPGVGLDQAAFGRATLGRSGWCHRPSARLDTWRSVPGSTCRGLANIAEVACILASRGPDASADVPNRVSFLVPLWLLLALRAGHP